MADERDAWASPSGGEEPPRYGERVPGWTPPPAPQPAGPTTYTPPPRRGLIPLHPLSFGQLLGASFGVIRWNPRATVLPALVVSIVQSALVYGITYGFGLSAVDRVERAANDADRSAILAGTLGVGGGAFLVTLAVSVFGGALLQGMIVTVAARGALGERPTARETFRAAIRRIWPLIGVALLLAVAETIGILLLVVVVVAIGAGVAAAADTTAGIVTAVIVGLILLLGFVVLVGFFAVKLMAVPSAIVLERRGVFAAIGRSWALMRGAFWRSFGLLLLVLVIVSFAAQIVAIPFSIIGGALGGLLLPNAGSDPQGLLATTAVTSLPSLVVTAIVSGIGQIAQISAVVLVYLDRRMRREGLDLELQRYTEQGGADPFEPTG